LVSVSAILRLGPIHYTRHQKHEFGTMDPNVKLFLEEMSKQLRTEIAGVKLEIANIKGGLTTYGKRRNDIAVAQQERDVQVASLQEVAESFTTWKPEVESSLTSVKLEPAKLNTFFNQDAKATNTTKAGVLPIGSASAPPSPRAHADGPHGHRVRQLPPGLWIWAGVHPNP
jgi:hypothetical protein